MEIVQRFKCDSCDNIIEPLKGKIIQGNIYMIEEDMSARGGLVGSSNIYEKIFKNVPENTYCDDCIKRMLYFNESKKENKDKNSIQK